MFKYPDNSIAEAILVLNLVKFKKIYYYYFELLIIINTPFIYNKQPKKLFSNLRSL
jgi:hypothetical protein